MEVQLYGAENVTTSKRKQYQVCLNRARQAATTRSDPDQQRAIERLEREIHQVTPAQLKVFDKLFRIMGDNHCRKLGMRQPVPEAYSSKNLLK